MKDKKQKCYSNIRVKINRDAEFGAVSPLTVCNNTVSGKWFDTEDDFQTSKLLAHVPERQGIQLFNKETCQEKNCREHPALQGTN